MSSASTDSATTVSPDTPVAAKKDDKENIVVKKDRKVAEAAKTKKPADKTKTSVPAVIAIEDTDEEDQDEEEDPRGMSSSGFHTISFLLLPRSVATVEPPRRPKIVAVQPRRSPRLAGLPPEMEGLGAQFSSFPSHRSVMAYPSFAFQGERNAARRVRRTKADSLEVA